tara:strand:+ start:2596 stop:3249 length:654 start_codon:yes stop_codon:yes gene_type:complete
MVQTGKKLSEKNNSRVAPALTIGELLDQAIRRSGMTKSKVAALAGVTRETVSRHVNNKVPIDTAMLETYANVLGIPKHTLLLPPAPVPFFGIVTDTNIVDTNIELNSILTPAFQMPAHWSCVLIESEQENINNRWEFFDGNDVKNNIINISCIGNDSICKTSKGEILRGIIYQPKANFFNVETLLGNKKQFKNIKLLWSTPILTVINLPVDIGCQRT